MTHKHKVAKRRMVGYTGPVTNDTSGYYRQNRGAHGGVTWIDRCSCGAVRRTNSNGNWTERGRWENENEPKEAGYYE